MSLREMLGTEDADRIHEQVDGLVDREDAIIVLVDDSRAISYAQGFGASPDQLELLTLEIERAVRSVAGPPTNNKSVRNYGEERENGDESGRGAGLRRNPGRFGRGGNGRAVDGESESVRTGGFTHGNSGRTTGRVVRLVREAAATDAR